MGAPPNHFGPRFFVLSTDVGDKIRLADQAAHPIHFPKLVVGALSLVPDQLSAFGCAGYVQNKVVLVLPLAGNEEVPVDVLEIPPLVCPPVLVPKYDFGSTRCSASLDVQDLPCFFVNYEVVLPDQPPCSKFPGDPTLCILKGPIFIPLPKLTLMDWGENLNLLLSKLYLL